MHLEGFSTGSAFLVAWLWCDVLRSMIKPAAKLACGYGVLYFLILGLSPTAFDMYLQRYTKLEDMGFTKDMPLDITDVREVTGVHTYEEVNKHVNDHEVVLFRNFSDCATKFETSLYPRRKDQLDVYREITYRPRKPASAKARASPPTADRHLFVPQATARRGMSTSTASRSTGPCRRRSRRPSRARAAATTRRSSASSAPRTTPSS